MRKCWLFGVGAITLVSAAATLQATFIVRQVPLDTTNNTANDGGGGTANQLENITEGEDLLNGTNGFLATTPVGNATPAVINYARGGGGTFGGDANFPTGDGTTDQNDFALEALGRMVFNTPGSYVFRVNSDDGFRLRFGVSSTGAGGSTYSESIGPRGPADTNGPGLFEPTGNGLDTRLTFFERGGGEEVEFSYSLNNGAFQLVGSTSDISVITIPEPASASLLGLGGLGGLGLLARRRRLA